MFFRFVPHPEYRCNIGTDNSQNHQKGGCWYNVMYGGVVGISDGFKYQPKWRTCTPFFVLCTLLHFYYSLNAKIGVIVISFLDRLLEQIYYKVKYRISAKRDNSNFPAQY